MLLDSHGQKWIDTLRDTLLHSPAPGSKVSIAYRKNNWSDNCIDYSVVWILLLLYSLQTMMQTFKIVKLFMNSSRLLPPKGFAATNIIEDVFVKVNISFRSWIKEIFEIHTILKFKRWKYYCRENLLENYFLKSAIRII